MGRPGDVDVVLHRERQAVERQALARGAALLQGARVIQQPFARRQRDPDAVVAPGRDARQRLLDDLAGVIVPAWYSRASVAPSKLCIGTPQCRSAIAATTTKPTPSAEVTNN